MATVAGLSTTLSVSDLSACHMGQTLDLVAQVLVIEGPMTLPTRIRATCQRCEESTEVEVNPDELAMLDRRDRKARLQFLGFAAVCSEGICRHSINVFKTEELTQTDYHTLLVGDASTRTLFSKLGHDPRLQLHLIGQAPPSANEIRLHASVTTNPSTRTIELVCHKYEELETCPGAVSLTDEVVNDFKRIGAMPIEELRLQIAPDMVGRPLVQEGRLLTLCSVARIPDVDGKDIRGSLIESMIGDTTTNKSECARDTAAVQGFGPIIQAENAARTGVTYTIIQSPSGGWSLVWGLLPRYHGTYAVIDGLEKWHSSHQQELRGVLRDQFVEVDKVVHGKRPACVRVTVTANPVKPVKMYPMKCMSIPDCRPFAQGPDIARVDLWFVFAENDVTPEQLARRSAPPRPEHPEVFQRFIYWAWSIRPADIEYESDAVYEIKSQSAVLMQEYRSSSLPVVHSGFRDTLCRLSVSYAVLGFSTPDGRRITVKREHVTRAVNFLRATYDAIDLRDYVTAEANGLNLTKPEAISSVIAVGERGIDILAQLALSEGKVSSTDMSDRLHLSTEVVQHLYGDLKNNHLIKTKRGAGVELTSKGVALVRWLRDQARVNDGKLMSQKRATTQTDVADFGDNNSNASTSSDGKAQTPAEPSAESSTPKRVEGWT